MENKTSISRWKLPIIRWALKELKPLLPALATQNFEKLAKFGIEDMFMEPNTGDYAIFLSGEKYKPSIS